MDSKIILSDYIEKVFETESNEFSEWFGYYNYDTLNYNQTKMLCNRAKFDGIKPDKNLSIDLGYYDLISGKWHYIDTTDTWNWQQGALLQWIPNSNNEDCVVYNCSRNGHCCARKYNLVTGVYDNIDWSIYGVTQNGSKSISLEMERSYFCRAYHYMSVENLQWEGRIVDADGIFEVDLTNNTRKRIISIHDIINLDFRQDFDKCKHWVEHIMISPSGKRICFLHRFSPLDNVLKYQTRLCVADLDGKNLEVISGWETYQWSHFAWKSDDEFVIYTQTPYKYTHRGSLKELIFRSPWRISAIAVSLFYAATSRLPYQISKLVHGKRHHYQYYSYDIKNSRFELNGCYENNMLNIDGHPSFTKDGRYMITDSYPDNKQMQRLIIFDTLTKKSIVLAKFFANYHKNPASCDLHPKLSINNNYLVVDSAYDSKHHMFMFKLNWEKIKTALSSNE